MKKRIITMILLTCLISSAFTISAFAVTGDIFMIGAPKIKGIDYRRINVRTDKALPIRVEIGGVSVKGTIRSVINLSQDEVNQAIREAFFQTGIDEKKLKECEEDIKAAEGLVKVGYFERVFCAVGKAVFGSNVAGGYSGKADKTINTDMDAFVDGCIQEFGSRVSNWAGGKIFGTAKWTSPWNMAISVAANSPDVLKYLVMADYTNEKVQKAGDAKSMLDAFYKTIDNIIEKKANDNGHVWRLMADGSGDLTPNLFGIPVKQKITISLDMYSDEVARYDNWQGKYHGRLYVDFSHDLKNFDDWFIDVFNSLPNFNELSKAYILSDINEKPSVLTKTFDIPNAELTLSGDAGEGQLLGGINLYKLPSTNNRFELKHVVTGYVRSTGAKATDYTFTGKPDKLYPKLVYARWTTPMQAEPREAQDKSFDTEIREDCDVFRILKERMNIEYGWLKEQGEWIG